MVDTISWIVFIAAAIGAFMYMRSVKATVGSGEVVLETLTKVEKNYVLVFVILSPIVAGAVFYYGWIKKLPNKAKRANRYSLLVFVILLALYLGLDTLL